MRALRKDGGTRRRGVGAAPISWAQRLAVGAAGCGALASALVGPVWRAVADEPPAAVVVDFDVAVAPAAPETATIEATVIDATALVGHDISAAVRQEKSSHAPAGEIRVGEPQEQLTLADFCLAPDRTVAALVAPGNRCEGFVVEAQEAGISGGFWANLLGALGIGAEGAAESAATAPDVPALPTESGAPAEDRALAQHEVRFFDAQGELLRRWPVDFAAEAINVGPDGLVYLGGSGVLAKYDLEGRLVTRGRAPQTAWIEAHREELLERAKM